jgi:alpha-amylase
MKTINLIFGCHSHQPVGNFEDVFQRGYELAYLPFLDVLERFPAVRVTQHFTGPLLDWFEANQPAFLERMKALVERGQIEIMGGGYYEPLLCAVPERDAVRQIKRMAQFCKKHFGDAPKGMWLTERVWEPHMPRILHEAGIEYTAVDDAHFLCAGLTPGQLLGYYLAEDAGNAVGVFPIQERLRYLIPFHPIHESIDFLRENATEDGTACAVIHDDGEKFGLWPETNMSVYGEGWLEAFFQALTDNQDWIKSVTYQQYMSQYPPLGRAYLPTASYHELMEWALPTALQRRLNRFQKWLKEHYDDGDDQRQFVRGSFWRSFLAKYPESNLMHKKMLRVSGKLNKLSGRRSIRNAKLAEAEKLLHQGQCNCAYWHGVFGGLYLNHLRTALYEKLVSSERILDEVSHRGTKWVQCDRGDFDVDGYDEAILENSEVSLAFSPRDGGTLYEWDCRRKPFNFVNTLSRREEFYHDLLRQGRVQVGEYGKGDQSIHELVRAKEAGLENYLTYDTYRRVCMRDHFFEPDVECEQLQNCSYRELGDFATGIYQMKTANGRVVMSRDGVIETGDGQLQVLLRKTIGLNPADCHFEVKYELLQRSGPEADLFFGIEWVINLLSGTARLTCSTPSSGTRDASRT